jgi:hypothetical protein
MARSITAATTVAGVPPDNLTDQQQQPLPVNTEIPAVRSRILPRPSPARLAEVGQAPADPIRQLILPG